MDFEKISRKHFIKTVGAIGLGTLLTTELFSQAKCDDVSGLKPEEIKQRKDLKYTDKSPDPKKLCSNCALWVPPKTKGACGGCNLIKGPIHPNGWCTSWVPKG
ncbi:MAG: high-potential iron-sulfur protein [Leptospiraceae bacterium]|nr:high-potential iron-sulfur protein [Leptospiraceae bacterium]MDW7977028.1 high-potential iron-sulfur protein [Leptospiraceae bacterium]